MIRNFFSVSLNRIVTYQTFAQQYEVSSFWIHLRDFYGELCQDKQQVISSVRSSDPFVEIKMMLKAFIAKA